MKYTALVLSVFVLLISSCEVDTIYVDSLELLRFKTGKHSTVVLTSEYLPGTKIHGTYKRRKGVYIVEFFSLELFGNWPHGWSYCEYEISGKYEIENGDKGFSIREIDRMMIWEIKKGELRHYDEYYREDDGLHKMRNRISRIREVSRFLKKEMGFPPFSPSLYSNKKEGKAFTKLQGKFLFPEVFGGVTIPFLSAGKYWDNEYTKENFPDHLIALRNTGSLWRDFEECPGIFISLYNIDYICDKITEKKT